MTEGTKSILAGCHHWLIHPILVIIAWRKLYGRWPQCWQIICIFLHDIGHIGLQYLSSREEKAKHWRMGARIAERLFGQKGYDLIAGHTSSSVKPRSEMYLPDKMSWLIAPNWWLHTNRFVEGFGHTPKEWKQAIKEQHSMGFPVGCHQLYVDRKKIATITTREGANNGHKRMRQGHRPYGLQSSNQPIRNGIADDPG